MKYSKSVKEAMKQLDIKKLRPKQGQAISSILNGHDTMVIAPTSFGKKHSLSDPGDHPIK